MPRARHLLVLTTVLLLACVAQAAPLCTLNTTDRTVTICVPTDGSVVTSPVHINAGTTDARAVTLVQIYVDSIKKYEVAANNLDTNLAMTAGAHRISVQAKDSLGYFKSTVNITVSSSTPPPGLSSLKHIFFMLQENRSADSYLGRFGQYQINKGATQDWDALPLNVQLKDNAGALVSPFHEATVCTENMTPAWNESHSDYDAGKMDRFMITNARSMPSTIDPTGTRAMGYYDWTDLPYYYELAYQFGTSDRFFSGVMSNTIPNRMYMFTATSFGHIRTDNAPTGTYWQQPTIFDKLTNAGISWRYYYQDNSVYLAQFSTWTRDSGKVHSITNYYTDIQNEATLPSVIFIERASALGLDEHPTKNVQKGAANTKTIIDALMASASWASSAFILTFDEGGGLYDHVPPFAEVKPDAIAPMLKSTDIVAGFDQSGFRIPLWVISPWSKPHYVSHIPRDSTAILKLIETRFGLTSLTARDAAQDDMTEFFDFSAPHFATPPPLPAQPTTGVCDKTKQNAPGH